MPEFGVSVQEPKPTSHSTNKRRSEQMGFGISGEKFTIPPTIIETSSVPSAFERISNRLSWQEAKLGNNCVFFELGEELPENKKSVGILFNGNNWQLRDKPFLESTPQKPGARPPKFDAAVICVDNFSENHVKLSTLLEEIRSRMGYNKPVYISVARQEDLDVEQLKHELSKMIQDAHFIMPRILVGRQGKNEDILLETRTKVRRHNTLPWSNETTKDTEVDETEREAARLKPKTPAEIRRNSFIRAKFKPDTPIPNGETCHRCQGPLSFMSHAKPNPDGDGFVQVMYRWCIADGKRGQEIPLKKS